MFFIAILRRYSNYLLVVSTGNNPTASQMMCKYSVNDAYLKGCSIEASQKLHVRIFIICENNVIFVRQCDPGFPDYPQIRTAQQTNQ